jgi:hypothetical protein
MQAPLHFLALIVRCIPAFFRDRREQVIVELALRQQLATCRFKLYWRWISKPGPGRPPISSEVRELIERLALDNAWGARKIHAELSMLGFTMSLATVSRYMPKRPPDRGKQQRWMTFLRNHREAITAMDFFVVPTVSFRLLYVWFVIDHGRRRIIHFNVTTNPTATWVSQQLREAFPDDSTPRYLIFDNDFIFSNDRAQRGASASTNSRLRPLLQRGSGPHEHPRFARRPSS